jgi:hypothetical protein
MRRRLAAALAVGLAMALAAAMAEGVPAEKEACLVMKGLSDAFLGPAALLGGAGLLSLCGAQGAFDMLGFAANKFLGLFRINGNGLTAAPDYCQYKKDRAENRRTRWFLAAAGGVYLILSFIFLFLYYLLD